MTFVKKYWWLILITFITPLILNIIMIQPVIFSIAGNDSSWLGFWGSYIGSILSSSIAIFILYKQQEQNHKENEDNRKLQLSVIEYNHELEKLRDLRSALIDFQVSFDYIEITKIAERFIDGHYGEEEYIRLKNLVRDIDEKSFKATTILDLMSSSIYVKNFNLLYNNIYNSYCLIIDDFFSFFDLLKDLPKNNSERYSYVKQVLKSWQQVNNKHEQTIDKIPGFIKQRSFYDIIVDLNSYNDLDKHAPEIVKERLLETLKDSALKEQLKDIIAKILIEEQNRIYKILHK